MQQNITTHNPPHLPTAQAVAGGSYHRDQVALIMGCAERESTPPAFAAYLVQIAKRAGGLQ